MPAPATTTEHRYSLARTGMHIWRIPLLRNIFIVCLTVTLLLPLYNWIFLSPSYRRMVTAFSENNGRQVAGHLMRSMGIGKTPITEKSIDADTKMLVQASVEDFNIDKLRLFDTGGTIIFSSDRDEIGRINTKAYFTDQVAKGKLYSQLIAKGTPTQEGLKTTRDVVEVYIPVMDRQAFLGAFEVYYDITQTNNRLEALLHRSNLTIGVIAIFMLGVVVAILFQASAAMMTHSKMDRAIHEARDLLEQRVQERTQELINANKDLQMEIMERGIAENNLRESEKRFRTLVETIPYGIQEIDPEGTITFANPAHAQIYGYEAKELIGTSILDLAAGAHEKDQLKAHLAYLFENQPRPNPWFSTDSTKEGRTINTQVDWNYKRDDQGRALGLIAVISDITHRKKAEKALLDNINFMNTLIDTIPNPVFYKDNEGFFLGCNVAYAQTLGLKKEQILGQRLNELKSTFGSDMAEHYHRQDLLLIQNPGIQAHEERVHCADGQIRDFALFKATFSDAEDNVAGMVGIMLDITEHKQAEKALKESKALFDAFMQHLPGLAFMKDPEGRYIYVNDAFTQLTDTAADKTIGRRAAAVWDDQTAKTIEINDISVLKTLVAANNMEDVRLPDGRERHLLTARFPIFRDDVLFALGGISIDITERTLAERQRRQLELQLQQTQKMEALGTLAGGIAHDFNNILAAIIGYTEIAAAETPKESATADYLQRVLESGERARSLVKQILAFSRQGDMEPKPVQVKLIVKEVLKMLRASLPATIDIVQEIHSDGAVMADPTQLHQVMMNLGTNAGYAMGQSGGKLTVELNEVTLDSAAADRYGETRPGKYLQLLVTDTGEGIAPEHLNKIFDPFFTTKPKGEGTGMGLAVVHGIVTGLGGNISADSTPGRGTQVEVLLPALPRETRVAETEKKVLPVGKERIFFVDDEPFQTDMFKHLLGLLGYEVETCNNSKEALALFEKAPRAFDLVITDMIMPEMTGDKLAQKMLAIRPDLPVILATGYSEGLTEAKAKEMGLKAFVLKPLVMEALAHLIRKVLDE